METNEGQYGSGMLQFPQPTMPFYADYIVSDSKKFEDRHPTNQFSEGYYNFEEASTTTPELGEQFVSDDDLIHVFEEFVEELNDKGHELFNKFLHKAEKEARFHKLKMLLAKLYSDGASGPTSQDRGVNVDSSTTVDDRRGKLERFKVKTVNLGGIVKEELKK